MIPEKYRLPDIDPHLIDRMTELCDQIESGNNVELAAREWHQHANREYDLHEFQSYYQSMEQTEFVMGALLPSPQFDAALTKNAALHVAKFVMSASGEEYEQHYYLGWLDTQFPNAGISDLIFWPDVWLENHPNVTVDESDAEQIVAAAAQVAGRSLQA